MIIIRLNNNDLELKYDFNAVCAIEERTGKSINTLMKEEVAGLNLIRLLIWAGLRWRNPNISADIVGTWIGQELIKGVSIEYFVEKSMQGLIDSKIISTEKNDNDDNEKKTLNINQENS